MHSAFIIYFMSLIDILQLALRNLRQAKLRAILTTMGVVVGVAVIVTMVSFGLGLQGNMLARFKALDLFSEIRVFGRSLSSMASAGADRSGRREDGERRDQRSNSGNAPSRILDDAAISEIAKIDGVAYVEPTINFTAYVRSNGKVLTQQVSGATVPNSSTRFQEFVAGNMISSPAADEVVVTERFARDFGYENLADAAGKTIEFLAPPSEDKDKKAEPEEQPNFFGIPLGEPEPEANSSGLVAHTFRIAGVLRTELKDGPGQGGLRGLLPRAGIYIPLQAARAWTLEHRGPMGEVALELARQSGALGNAESEGYDSAVVRVDDPVALTEVRKRLTEQGFSTFSIVDELEQLRTVFLILDSVLGLLGRYFAAGRFVWNRQHDDHVNPRAHARNRNHESDRRGRSRNQTYLFCRGSSDWSCWRVDRDAGSVGRGWFGKPACLPLYSQTAGSVLRRFLFVAAMVISGSDPVRTNCIHPRCSLSSGTSRGH